MSELIIVTAAILIQNSRILIAKRKSTDCLAGKWEFPGGKIENGETPEQCLVRELKEELNIDASVGEFLGSNTHHYDHISIILMAFRTYWDSGWLEINDHDNVCWVSLDQLTKYDFAPADKPFVDMLWRGQIDFCHT